MLLSNRASVLNPSLEVTGVLSHSVLVKAVKHEVFIALSLSETVSSLAAELSGEHPRASITDSKGHLL